MRRECPLTTDDVVAATSGRPRGTAGALAGVTTDSRNVRPGDLFVALRGPNFDGHDHVTAAFQAGAIAALVETALDPSGGAIIEVGDTLSALGALGRWWRRKRAVPVLGLTGSNGKTSTKELAASLLATRVDVLHTEGNLNNRIGVPMTLLGIADHHDAAVVEMGMNQRGEIGDLTRICEPDVALLINVGPAHIGELGSLEAIAEAKAEMLHHAPETATLVVNADDPRVMEHASRFDRYRLRTFGEAADADVRLLRREVRTAGQRLDIVVDDSTHRIELGLSGRHAASNAVAALAAVTALPLGVRPAPDRWIDAWRDIEPISGRFSVRQVGDVHLIDDAYNANPGSLDSALGTLSEIRDAAPFGVVLGQMEELGAHSTSAHRAAGEAIARSGAAFLATLGIEARPAADAARAMGVPTQHADEDLDVLWAFVREHLSAGSWLLIKGSRKSRLERLIPKLEAR